jgi:hypothetical protein
MSKLTRLAALLALPFVGGCAARVYYPATRARVYYAPPVVVRPPAAVIVVPPRPHVRVWW